jgi:hypothetical protein
MLPGYVSKCVYVYVQISLFLPEYKYGAEMSQKRTQFSGPARIWKGQGASIFYLKKGI